MWTLCQTRVGYCVILSGFHVIVHTKVFADTLDHHVDDSRISSSYALARRGIEFQKVDSRQFRTGDGFCIFFFFSGFRIISHMKVFTDTLEDSRDDDRGYFRLMPF